MAEQSPDLRMAAIVGQLPAIVWTTDQQLRFTASYGAGLAALGLSPDQVRGMSLQEFLRTDDEQFPAIAAHRKSLAGKSADFEQHWAGIHYWSHVEPFRDDAGEIVGCLGLAIEITEQKQIQDELRLARDALHQRLTDHSDQLKQSRRQLAETNLILRAVIEGISDGVVVADREQRIAFMNAAGRQITGIDDTDSRQQEWTEHYGLFLPDQQTPFPTEELPLARAIRGEEVQGVEMYLCNASRPEGMWITVDAAPVVGSNAEQWGGLAVFRDITREKQMQDDLRREHEVMRQLIAMQDRDRRLVSYEIHDGLVQQVTAALMHVQTLEGKISPEDQSAIVSQQTAAELLSGAVDEARRLIGGLSPPILDELGIAAAIEYLVNDACNDIPRVELSCQVRQKVFAKPLENAIFRIAQEAIQNVRRHSGAQRARVEFVELKDSLRLVVQDWGVGFDLAAVPSDRFGLRGIRERVRLLGSEVDLQSTPGEGTRLAVDFPILQNEPADEA